MDIVPDTNTILGIVSDTISDTGIVPDMDTISNTGTISDTDIGYGKSICPILFVNQFGSENYKKGGGRGI